MVNETLWIGSDGFPEASPEAVGISSRDIAGALTELLDMEYDLHSLQIFRSGKRVFAAAAAPYRLTDPHRLLSAAKAIIAAAVLFAIDEGKLGMEDQVAGWFADMLPETPDRAINELTVYDLLTMQTGQETDEAFLYFLEHPDEDLCRAFFHTPFQRSPGTHFFYNNAVPHLLFTLVERASGCPFEAWLERKLCRPLGISIVAQHNSNGVYDPVTTVVTPEDFLKLAIWFLQEGRWNGQQLLRPELLRAACAQQVYTGIEDDPNARGYGMQLWRNAFGGYRMDGGGGQIALMVPEQDMAVVFTGNEGRGREAVRLLHERVIARVNGRPLPPDPEGEAHLAQVTAQLMTRAPRSVTGIPESRRWEGDYTFAPNAMGLARLSFTSVVQQGETVYRLAGEMPSGQAFQVDIGTDGAWQESARHVFLQPDLSIQNRIYGSDPQRCYLSGGWRQQDEFVFTLKSIASMGEYCFRLRFDPQGVSLYVPRGVSAGMKQAVRGEVLRGERGVIC